MRPPRRTDYDALRVLAAFGVIWIHICAFMESAGFGWALAITCFRWVVPVFLMLTGAVLALRQDDQADGAWLKRLSQNIMTIAQRPALAKRRAIA